MSSWLLQREERHRCVDVASGVGKILVVVGRREGRREGEVSKLRRRRRRISKRMSRRRRRRIWREKAAMEKERRSRGVCAYNTRVHAQTKRLFPRSILHILCIGSFFLSALLRGLFCISQKNISPNSFFPPTMYGYAGACMSDASCAYMRTS